MGERLPGGNPEKEPDGDRPAHDGEMTPETYWKIRVGLEYLKFGLWVTWTLLGGDDPGIGL